MSNFAAVTQEYKTMATENGAIPTLNMDVFKRHAAEMDYIDDDFVIMGSAVNVDGKGSSLRVGIFFVVECVEGRAQFNLNGKTQLLHSGEFLICLPTTILSDMLVSTDNEIRFYGFSTSFLRDVVKVESQAEKVLAYFYTNPIQHRMPQQEYISYYHLLLEAKINQPDKPFRRETIRYLVKTVFCEMLEGALQYITEERNGSAKENTWPVPNAKRSSYVFKQFLSELSKDNGIHRSVAYYAEKLCYSPKYLSSVVRQASGRTALDWINEYTLEQIKHRLKHSDKTIKEIAEELNFSNQSFFGKYVKTHLGMSPVKYRESSD